MNLYYSIIIPENIWSLSSTSNIRGTLFKAFGAAEKLCVKFLQALLQLLHTWGYGKLVVSTLLLKI